MVRSGDIIGIFDMDNTTISKWTRKFLNGAEKKGQVISVTTDLPKTFVVVDQRGRGEQRVYLSQISSATLRKRTGYSYSGKLRGAHRL
ncbi:MAG: DUF370 domain-containing protein, partial [Angelakisella sp.]